MYASQIRDRRTTLGYTQMHLAEIAGLDVKTVQRAEAGHRISGETLLALCSALNTDPAALAEAGSTELPYQELAVIEPDAGPDGSDIIADLRHSLSDLTGLDYLVIPHADQPAAQPLSATYAGIGLGICSLCGGPIAVKIGETFGLPPSPWIFGLGAVSVVLMMAWLDWWVRRRLTPTKTGTRHAYALGREQIVVLTVTAENVARQIHRIDSRRPIERSERDGRVSYVVAIEGGRTGLYNLPADPRIDALMMRNKDRWGYREIPRLTAAHLAQA